MKQFLLKWVRNILFTETNRHTSFWFIVFIWLSYIKIQTCKKFIFICQKNVGNDAAPAFLRRNSFTPLSSQDQIKRPRLYSAGNQSQSRILHTPTLPSMQFSEASEGAELQSQVSERFLKSWRSSLLSVDGVTSLLPSSENPSLIFFSPFVGVQMYYFFESCIAFGPSFSSAS